jgi:hypothetical protein
MPPTKFIADAFHKAMATKRRTFLGVNVRYKVPHFWTVVDKVVV